MGVYINMEMPESGTYEVSIDSANGKDKTVMSLFVRGEGGLICCGVYELAPVPQHGRLIDADALTEKLKKHREYHSDGSNSGAAISNGIGQCLDIINGKECPTIIPAELPVLHGTFAATSEQEALKRIAQADDSKLSATIKCGGSVTCKEYVDTARNLRWTGTHGGEHIIPAEEGET